MSRIKVRQVEIAEEAGVSVATVDRVLNERGGVNARTEQRVREAIKNLERGGAASDSQPIESLQFDFILPANPNIFINLLEDAAAGVKNHLPHHAFTTTCHRVEGFNPQVLADSIYETGKDSDGLVVMALENPVVREAVNAVADSGTPVVTIVSNLSTQKKIGYAGLNNRAAGRTAGYLMNRLVAARAGKLAVFEGSLQLSYRDHQEREVGFKDALREYAPEMEIVGRWATQDNFEEAYRQTKILLSEQPDLLGIYSIGGGVRGIARAIKEEGWSEKVVLIGHDLTRYTREFLIDGTLDVVINQDPFKEVLMACQLLLNHHSSNTVLLQPDHIPIEIFFRENLS